MRNYLKSSKGFTLIELLIVIAVLGVLAAVVLVAIDPVEQLARGRDSGRKTTVAQIGHAMVSYYTTNAAYPAAAAWNTTLTNSGDLKLVPADPGGSVAAPACAAPGVALSGWCYKVNATPEFVLYSHMESKTEQRKGTCAGTAANTWYVYSSVDGKSGTVCQAGEPAAGGSYTYY
jgi:prepilin-type N-terminal cleavage/methylation domain-containing protein